MILGILESSSGSLNGVFDRFEKYWFLVKIQLILGLHSKNSCKKSSVLISIYIFIMIFSILRFASRCKSVGVLFSCFLTTNIIINNYTHNIVNDIPWWLSVTRLLSRNWPLTIKCIVSFEGDIEVFPLFLSRDIDAQ